MKKDKKYLILDDEINKKCINNRYHGSFEWTIKIYTYTIVLVPQLHQEIFQTKLCY